MARLSIQEVKLQKNYYRNNFRRAVLVLFVSMSITLIIVFGIFYQVVTKPESDFYSTNSAGFITMLKSRAQPNMSSTALLKPDPPEEIQIKQLNIPDAAAG